MKLKRRDFLKQSSAGAITALMARYAAGVQDTRTRPPNFVIFLADDAGPSLYGCYGGRQARTPRLDSLAASGVAFRTCWATPICSPSRAMFMTGRYAQRTGWYHNSLRIPLGGRGTDFLADSHTFQSLLKKAGYATCLAGKWQLPGLPSDGRNGIDEHCIWAVGAGGIPKGQTFAGAMEDDQTPSRYWHPAIIRNGVLLPTEAADFGPDIVSGHLIDFIHRNKDRPFCAYYPMLLPHGTRKGYTSTPQLGKVGDLTDGSEQGGVNYTDVLVGRVFDALKKEGLDQNTVVIYASDNGSPGKNTATDVGARVPMIVHGPGIVQQRGMTDELISFADVLPTLLGLAGAALPAGYDIDGMDLSGFLTGRTDRTRDLLFSYVGTARMVRDKRWVLEGVDAANGHPRGWMLDTAGKGGVGSAVQPGDEAARAARKAFEEVLMSYPAPDYNAPSLAPILDRYDKDNYRHNLGPHRPMKRVVPVERQEG